jgi:hypothetical protein
VLGAALTYVREHKPELIDAIGPSAVLPIALAGE